MTRVAVRIGILTVSDRASRGEYEDRSGPAVRAELERLLVTPFEAVTRLVPDEGDAVERALVELCDTEGCCLVLTTGGTGPAPRDVTPEATRAVVDRELPGFGELMRRVSFDVIPTAILSRQTAGLRGHSLIVNLPGSPSGARDCLRAVFPAVPDCLDLIGGPALETDPDNCSAPRPHRRARPDGTGVSGTPEA